jgi:ribulose-5-phosphate 4-epimerase/fuculose-1-phosphate aldolase
MEGGRLELSHHNDLSLDDRIVYDDAANGPVADNDEGDRIAELMGDKTVMVMANHGVTVVGPSVHDAFDELYTAERTCMYQLTARMAGGTLRRQPDRLRRNYHGAWGDRYDARLHLDAWRRVLDREEPDYAT